MDKWVLVVDGDAVSTRQVQTCRNNRVGLGGFIECNKPENKDAEICSAVDYFPAFCNTQDRTCAYGIRDTRESLLALQALAPTSETR